MWALGQFLWMTFWLILLAGAALVDLVLLPFRPLLPTVYYVDTFKVTATRLKSSTPVHVDHYVIQPPAGADWYRITKLEGAAQSPFMEPESGTYYGARELFIRNPTARRPSAARTLLDSRLSGGPAPSGPPRGRIEPAALVRVEQLEPGTAEVKTRLAAFVEASRTAPNGDGLLTDKPGLYQVERTAQSFIQVGNVPCLRDEFVYLWLDHPERRSTVSRHLAFTLACADPACPGQALSLVVRGKADSGGGLERQGRSFLEGLRVDPAVTPVCGVR